MVCPNCGTVTDAENVLCPKCGALLNSPDRQTQTGAQAIRQGRRAREEIRIRQDRAIEKEQQRKRRSGASHGHPDPETVAEEKVNTPPETPPGTDEAGTVEEDPSFERGYRRIYAEESMSDEAAAKYTREHEESKPSRWHLVNWMKVGLILAAVFILAIFGGWLYLTRTGGGQKIMARLGRDASSTALWAVGEERMDQGDIRGAIADFEKAMSLDELDGVVDVDGMLLLGSAYEADGRTDDAAGLYEAIYTETPSRTEAYVNHIRILLASGREGDMARAAALMRTAYQKTGESSFNTQRNDLIPAAPEVDLTAGYYETKKYIAITSYQGYDVYYTFDENAKLPEDGIRFTERIFLDEGVHVLRAVAVNGELVSDVLTGTYKIIMPSPQTPRATLAPKTYQSRQWVKLKPGKDNEHDDDIVIYYTVDGSEPDADSPIYDGNAIHLPSGRVYLKAVAVNRYNKVSNTLEVFYKIEAKPYPLTGYTPEDTANGLVLYNTAMTDFQKAYGEGDGYESFFSETLNTECRTYTYPWGSCVMAMKNKTWVLAELRFTNGTFKGPRGTAIGDTEAYVVGKFRDMGQVESASGNRGLYANDDGTGKIWRQEDGSKIIRYLTYTDDGHYWQLDYITDRGGTVTAIDMIYLP